MLRQDGEVVGQVAALGSNEALAVYRPLERRLLGDGSLESAPMRLLVWIFRAFVFFTLFAFALNNEQEVAVHWFFGAQWRAPLVIVVLAAFAGGAAIGVLAMVPAWWRHRRIARRQAPAPATPAADARSAPTAETTIEHPPREGL